jgi:8-oxo-dGTP pyrophosphatase MutT (NUDIX family)
MKLYSKSDVLYLPQPNHVEFLKDSALTPLDLTPTAFMVPLMADGSVVMAQNRRRGLEFPGGHIDPGESSCAAAHRETVEETGYWVSHIKALGYLIQTCEAPAPEGYRYPWPISFQQFYTGDVMSSKPYVENDECLAPVVLSRSEAEERLDAHRFAIYQAALQTIR